MRRVDDIEEIKQLKARYFRLIDTKDWEGLAGVFADDVTIDIRSEGAGIHHGSVEFIPRLERLLKNAVSVHHGHMPEITLTSPTTATGVWAMEDWIWWEEGAPWNSLHGWGHYHEEYVKLHDGWRIRSLVLTRLHRVID